MRDGDPIDDEEVDRAAREQRAADDARMSRPAPRKCACGPNVCCIVCKPEYYGYNPGDFIPDAMELLDRSAGVNTADHLLGAARDELDQRKLHYDASAGERSMERTVNAFNAVYGTAMTEVQGWQFMSLLKMVRASQGAFKLDNYVDQTAYSALAGECAAKPQQEK